MFVYRGTEYPDEMRRYVDVSSSDPFSERRKVLTPADGGG
jgi:hypothetical protein